MAREVLVVGGDGLLGRHLAARLERDGLAVWKTTRRDEALGEKRIHLDLRQCGDFMPPSAADTAVILAAITDIRRCEQEQAGWDVNVGGAVSLAKRCLLQGMFVVFASSLVVFGENRDWPGENDPHAAQLAYAKQKSMAETAMREEAAQAGAADRLAITRITRTATADGKPFSDWLRGWKEGRVATPFTDILFSPVTPEYVADGLATAIQKRAPGNFHFSGDRSMSYAEFCHGLANRLGVAENLVRPISSVDMGVAVAFAPRCGGLGMERTKRILGIGPQASAAVLDVVAHES